MRRRLSVAIVGVAAAAVTLFALPLGIVLDRSYRDEELLRLQRDTVAATRTIDVSSHGDPIELPPSRDTLAVYDQTGRRIAGSGPPRPDAVVRAALHGATPAERVGDGRLVAAVPLLSGERVSGALRAQRSGAAASHDSRSAWLVLLAAGSAVIALAALAALVLGRRLARPTEQLAAAARRLGDGDFSARAPHAGIPELDAVATALDTTAQRLDALVTRERAFSADASHQLRTPLTALRVELEALELREGASPELTGAREQVERLQATVETLLSIARDLPRADAIADLSAIAEDAAARWHAPLAQAGRPLRVAGEHAPALAAASPRVVEEILDVLVANAHAHGGGAVTLTIRSNGDALALDVADEGAGIAGDPEHAFARRTGTQAGAVIAAATAPHPAARPDAAGGHGIGLALARSLAHAEGGRLVLSHPAPCPIFTLWLPTASSRERDGT